MSGTRDRIILSDLGFYGYHGVMLEENKLGQRFRIDLECGIDLRRAGDNDLVEATVSYADIYDLVKVATEETRYKLIEALAQHIVDRLFEAFAPFDWIRIRIRKPEAPIPAVVGEFAVEIFRTRDA
ncbi:MAG: dihydroneopterin aldolase [Alphaproteobacteria bacterium]|nr:dihydroneopterin aldolase [Alphaproteobacteria bacterium]